MGIPGIALKKENIVKAIHEKKGILTHAAKMLNCHYSAIYKWMDKDEDVAKAVSEAREEKLRFYEDDDAALVDKSRETFHRLLDENNVSAAIFIAKTKGGFEGDGFGGKSINVNVIDK